MCAILDIYCAMVSAEFAWSTVGAGRDAVLCRQVAKSREAAVAEMVFGEEWMTAVVIGKVVQFDDNRGYGFIAPEGGGEDVFVHVNDLEDDKRLLGQGATVEFLIEDGDRGPKASGVHIVEKAAQRSVGSMQGGRSAGSGECDILGTQDYEYELTESMLEAAPGMTAGEVVQVRRRLLKLAQGHGWIEP